MEWMQELELVLASSSPRRIALMREMGFRFEVIPADIDEDGFSHLEPYRQAMAIAEAKAKHVLTHHDIGRRWVLAADTIVVLKDRVLGKPGDKRTAYRMLASLSGQKHTVISGVVIYCEGRYYRFHEATDVLFRPLVHEEIEYYLEKYRPYDKAGAYGIQDWIGLTKIASIRGSYSNVVGLPTEKVYTFLQQLWQVHRSPMQ